jgi:hypothetical protein
MILAPLPLAASSFHYISAVSSFADFVFSFTLSPPFELNIAFSFRRLHFLLISH